MNIYEIIIFGLLFIYVGIKIKEKYSKESFHTNMNHYKNAKTYTDIYDDFYSFIYDDLFYQKNYYLKICNVLLKYQNNVYNNHLCIGIKHGGHMNQLLKNNMKTTSISRSPAIIRVCKYKYKDNDYKYFSDLESNGYIFDDHTFTHISILDNELYYINNLHGLLYNCSKWIILKGYMMIQCYEDKESLKKTFLKIGENSTLRFHNPYTHTFEESKHNNSLVLKESLKDHNKERKNYHTLYYYSPDEIKTVANEYDFKVREKYPISKYESILVLQKL
jgi:hypothetical protein